MRKFAVALKIVVISSLKFQASDVQYMQLTSLEINWQDQEQMLSRLPHFKKLYDQWLATLKQV